MIERHSVPLPDAKLALVLHLPDTDGRAPCVVACHGLSASKDSDKYLLLGTELPRAALPPARFDFRGCGQPSGPADQTPNPARSPDGRGVRGLLGGHGGPVPPLPPP